MNVSFMRFIKQTDYRNYGKTLFIWICSGTNSLGADIMEVGIQQELAKFLPATHYFSFIQVIGVGARLVDQWIQPAKVQLIGHSLKFPSNKSSSTVLNN